MEQIGAFAGDGRIARAIDIGSVDGRIYAQQSRKDAYERKAAGEHGEILELLKWVNCSYY